MTVGVAMEISTKKKSRGAVGDDLTRAAPAFSLYGETPASYDDDFVHIEEIAARSQRYDWEIGRHVHHGLCQILMLAAGEVAYRLDEDAGSSEGPCALVVPPATVHAFRFTPGAVGHVLTFAESRLVHGAPERRALVEATFARPAALPLDSADPAAARLARLIAEIAVEFRERGAGWTTAVEGLTAAAVALTARLLAAGLHGQSRGREAELYGRFRALLETAYAEHRPVGWYASALGVSESRLDRAARAVAGKSTHAATQDRLMLEARRRLAYVAAPATKIAYELGFPDAAYFWRFFRRRAGVTPTEFRRAARRRALGGAWGPVGTQW
jgi:AraC family transcriptional activator of pobA